MPIKAQLQHETLASAETWTVQRTIARAFLISVIVHHTRLNDGLGTVMWVDDVSPDGVIRGRVSRAKDGLPLELYAPAEGWLGTFTWLREHLEETAGRKHALPAFESRPAGTPSTGSRLLPGVMPKDHARSSLRDMLAQAPLRMSKAEFDALRITTHSPHGTGPDMVRFMGLQRGWTEPMARQLGHWQRDKNAPQEDPRKVPGAPQRGAPDGAPCTSGAMSLRYSQGGGRRGQRQEQLELRTRFVNAVRTALRRFDRPWVELPSGLDDWEILLADESPPSTPPV
jgi:hypothetical protein